MKKLFRSGIALLLVLVTFAACGSKDSVPTVDQIKEDLIGQEIRAYITCTSIESLEIIDTTNTKSTDGQLIVHVVIEYTAISESYDKSESSELRANQKANIYYKWTDDAGWKYSLYVQKETMWQET